MVDVRVPDGRVVRFPDEMPREEIRAFIQSKFPETSSTPAVSVDAAPIADSREGMFPQFASGMTEGAAGLLSLPNTIEKGLRSIGPAIGNAMGGNFAYPESSILPDAGAQFLNAAQSAGSMTAPTDNGWEQGARRVGQEIGSNIIPLAGPGGSLARKGAELGLTVASGLGAAAANQVFPGNPLADMAGQALGFGLGAGAVELGRKAITPYPMSPPRVAIMKALQGEGVELTAGQATGNKRLQYAESELGGDIAQQFMENQGDQFTNAALQRVGVSAPRATPEVLDRAYRNIGSEFDRLASNATVPVDQPLIADLQGSLDNYKNLVEGNAAPAVQNYIDEIFDHAAKSPAGQPLLTGEQYQSLHSRIGADMRRTTKPELASALGDIQAALDDSVERYLSVANPDDIPAWQDIRNKYRNFLVIEKAAAGAGENTAQGILSPAQIRSAIVQQSKRGYVRGMGDFADLARNATAAMSPLPNSGTAQRLGAKGVVTSIPTIAGTLLGGAAGGGNPLAAIVGGAAGAVVPGQVGKALISPLGRKYLTNQAVLPGPGYGANARNAVLRALVGQGSFDQ